MLKRRVRNQSAAASDEPAERRRRIAGERPKPAEDATEDAEGAEDATDADDELGAGGESTESRTLAQALASIRPGRARLVAATTALLIGVVVGAVLTGLVYAGMRAFQAIYDTPAGDGVGAVVLVVVLAVSMLAGRYLLGRRGLPDPSATSLLGIMLMVIVTLGLLLPVVFSAWMLAIAPALGGLSYLVSHLLIAHFGDHG